MKLKAVHWIIIALMIVFLFMVALLLTYRIFIDTPLNRLERSAASPTHY